MVLCNTALCQIDQNSPVMSLTAKETIFSSSGRLLEQNNRSFSPLHHEVQGNLHLGV